MELGKEAVTTNSFTNLIFKIFIDVFTLTFLLNLQVCFEVRQWNVTMQYMVLLLGLLSITST